MGVTIDGTELFAMRFCARQATRKINETYSVTGRKAVSENRCNEYLFDVTHRPSGYTYQLQTRLYDDGFAYRFILPGDGKRIVNGEAAQWRPPHRSRVWFAERNSGMETAHLCRRMDIHDGRQPAHRLPTGARADHAVALPNP